jgi:amino acid transporter
MDSLKSFGQRAPFKRTDTGDVQKSESKDHGVAREKELDLPAYSHDDVERRASVASYNISGIHDDTHRKLKPSEQHDAPPH